MTTAPWYVPAFLAAVIWGLHYPLVDHALKKLSLPGVLLLTVIPVLMLAPLFLRDITIDLRTLQDLPWSERLLLLAPALTSVAGSVMLFAAINAKNATLASLIEVSYPAFVAVFAWLIFKEVHLTASALIGGGMVIAGVVLIASSNT